MKNLIEPSYQRILSKKTNLSQVPDEFRWPCFDGYSIANIAPSICHWLSAESSGFQPGLHFEKDFGESFDHVILIVIDGLGFHQMKKVKERLSENVCLQRFEKDSVQTVLTSTIPSTTIAALTSIWTGAAPGQHGLVGYEMWDRDLGFVMNCLPYSPVSLQNHPGLIAEAGLPPEKLIPVPTLGQQLEKSKVIANAYMPIMLAYSNLTKCHMSGMEIVPYRRFGDLWCTLLQKLEFNRTSRTCEVIYWNDIDTYGHLMGMEDDRVYFDLDQFYFGMEKAIESITVSHFGKTLLLVTADHGQIRSVPDSNRDLKNHPGLLKNIWMMPTGENRLTYFYVKNGHAKDLQNYIESEWPNEFHLFSSQDFIKEGVYGTSSLHPDLENRIGEMMAAAKGESYFWWPKRPDKLQARHGGLSENEMIVPLTGYLIE